MKTLVYTALVATALSAPAFASGSIGGVGGVSASVGNSGVSIGANTNASAGVDAGAATGALSNSADTSVDAMSSTSVGASSRTEGRTYTSNRDDDVTGALNNRTAVKNNASGSVYNAPATAAATVGGMASSDVGAGLKAAGNADVATKAQVRAAQQALSERGHYTSSVDGMWGPNTANAIRNFQSAHGMSVTGQLDAQTRAQLGITSAEMNAPAGAQGTTSHQDSTPAGQIVRE